MGNKLKRKTRSLRLLQKRRACKANYARTQKLQQGTNATDKKRLQKVPALAVLCERVIKKFKLLPEPKKFTPPESFTIVGGKPLRKRSLRQSTDDIKEERKKRKCRNPRSLAALCQIVINEHNLLPESEETIRPYAGTSQINKNSSRKRGRPRKEVKKDAPTKRTKGRPRKDAAASEDNTANTVTYLNYSTFLRQSEKTRRTKIEEELNLPIEKDPLRQDDEDYTVVIKEENIDDEDDISTQEGTVQVPQATSRGIAINPLASSEIPGPSGRAAAHYMTVVMDEYQVFANSIAEQLRALPPNRALLLQLDIQSMIDNEKQLLMHEN